MEMRSLKVRLVFAVVAILLIILDIKIFKADFYSHRGGNVFLPVLIIATLVSVGVALGGVKGSVKGSIQFSDRPELLSNTKNHLNFSVKIKKKDDEGLAVQKFNLDTVEDDSLLRAAKIAYASFGILSVITGLPLETQTAGFILALKKAKEAKGTIYESHFWWIIRTYCIATLIAVILTALLTGSVIFSYSTYALFKPLYLALHRLSPTFNDDGITIFLYMLFGLPLVTIWGVWVYVRINRGYKLLVAGMPVF